MDILHQHCVTRTQKSAPTASFGQGLNHGSLPKEVKVGGATVFIVSQRASSIMYADKIIVLDDGRAVNIGTHEELLAASPVYREIYDSQFDSDSKS